MTDQEQLIRQAIAYEAAEAVDSRVVLASVRKEQRKPGGRVFGVIGLTVAAAAAAVIVPVAVNRTTAEPANLQDRPQYVLLTLTQAQDGSTGQPRVALLTRVEVDGAVSAVEIPPFFLQRPRIAQVIEPPYDFDFVEENTGVRPDHYVDVNWDGLGRLAEVVGGIEVCVKQPDEKVQYLTPTTTLLPPGRHTITGEQVMKFATTGVVVKDAAPYHARFRALLTGFAAKLTRANATALVKEATRSVTVDEGFDLVTFARRFKGAVPVRTTQIPFARPTWSNGSHNIREVRTFITQFFSGESPADAHAAPEPGDDGCVY
ncbi:hypothetical protein BBK82_20350 [Lentzea guizhouensis]|uniref:Cell envelope-related transcriptional attenuator domain-containing protein n=1 Tax=Lentzea guizhouensis TaxID=1586287 RepID=A0A1B2HK23_9PSEU|nr:LCP family protein [Lentzea guizhouensis]ANZ38061.1 hypothetical protein BBK82_20350 [Lentzea guizhouensis]